jgi:hypothetical protein
VLVPMLWDWDEIAAGPGPLVLEPGPAAGGQA